MIAQNDNTARRYVHDGIVLDDEPGSPPRVVGLHETHERRVWLASLAVFPVAVLVYLLVVVL